MSKKEERPRDIMARCWGKHNHIYSAIDFVKERGGRVKRSTLVYYLEMTRGFNPKLAEHYVNGFVELGDLTEKMNEGESYLCLPQPQKKNIPLVLPKTSPCPGCGKLVQQGQTSCPHCGKELTAQV